MNFKGLAQEAYEISVLREQEFKTKKVLKEAVHQQSWNAGYKMGYQDGAAGRTSKLPFEP